MPTMDHCSGMFVVCGGYRVEIPWTSPRASPLHAFFCYILKMVDKFFNVIALFEGYSLIYGSYNMMYDKAKTPRWIHGKH